MGGFPIEILRTGNKISPLLSFNNCCQLNGFVSEIASPAPEYEVVARNPSRACHENIFHILI